MLLIMKELDLVDYHMHTVRCGHAEGRLDDYAAKAIDLGLREIGFSDHLPLLHISDANLSMGLEELPLYVREVEELRERFRDFPIRLGIEVDYLPETASRLRPLVEAYPFDYVMGSLHFVDGWCFDNPHNIEGYKGRDIYVLWERYFDLLGEVAESGIFDILAHPDLIKKFGFRPEGDVHHLYLTCLDRIAETGTAVEVNTAGLRKPVKEIYPAEDFLLLCRGREIPVTLGSDAHHPDEVGMDFGQALAMLRRVGYEELALFSGRERSSLKL
jgi:histidinol-phosphatase (PHP family)